MGKYLIIGGRLSVASNIQSINHSNLGYVQVKSAPHDGLRGNGKTRPTNTYMAVALVIAT